ncbi:MAG: YaiI/YqxD family protein [Myxococcales bacterium]|nr:YaiI/YqxD family protein [Myxococcales bacterium]MCB9531438.1 YaiI/YqxD family protein [Myxococcales bacterium]MCB9534051.1 YaiI/YqxD family protein [Myxococcales bacterium]
MTDPPDYAGPFTIWVDGDGLPGAVREVVVRAAAARRLRVVIVANRYVEPPPTLFVEGVVVGAGPDVADTYIVEHAVAGDLVISDDVPLAARAVEVGADVLQFRGRLLDRQNVREALSIRNFGAELRDMGIETQGPSGWRPKDRQAFSNGLDKWVSRALARRRPTPAP